jgi:hypothetical protein
MILSAPSIFAAIVIVFVGAACCRHCCCVAVVVVVVVVNESMQGFLLSQSKCKPIFHAFDTVELRRATS